MKTCKFFLTAIIILLIPAYAFASDLGLMRTSYVKGDIQLQPEGLSEWIPVALNMPLREGDRLWVPESGRLEIQLSNGSFLRLDEKSSLDIIKIDRDFPKFYLAEGQAYVYYAGLSNAALTLDTPVTSVVPAQKSTFITAVPDRFHSSISVLNGSVYADDRYGKTTVHAGRTISFSENGYARLYPLSAPDSWERWNRERDILYEDRGYSSRYLPDELDIYASEFDSNGTWIHTGEYGYVWRPAVRLSVEWSPYRLGRWTWFGDDYVWISYEPWGWAPYHYGRWAFTASIGWYWVPPAAGAVYWGPGYVGWVNTPEYVAWVPLAPREIYYGYGYFGPFSVNIINITINRPVIRHKYRNVYVDGGVTVVHHDTFVRGKPMRFRPHKNPFLHERISIGRPGIKPEKTSYMPVIRKIPGSKLAPRRLRDNHVRHFSKPRPYKTADDKKVIRAVPNQIAKARLHRKDNTILRNKNGTQYQDTLVRREVHRTEKVLNKGHVTAKTGYTHISRNRTAKSPGRKQYKPYAWNTPAKRSHQHAVKRHSQGFSRSISNEVRTAEKRNPREFHTPGNSRHYKIAKARRHISVPQINPPAKHRGHSSKEIRKGTYNRRGAQKGTNDISTTMSRPDRSHGRAPGGHQKFAKSPYLLSRR